MDKEIVNVIRNGILYTYRRNKRPTQLIAEQYYPLIIKLNLEGVNDGVIAEVLGLKYKRISNMRRRLGLKGITGGPPTKTNRAMMVQKAKDIFDRH